MVDLLIAQAKHCTSSVFRAQTAFLLAEEIDLSLAVSLFRVLNDAWVLLCQFFA